MLKRQVPSALRRATLVVVPDDDRQAVRRTTLLRVHAHIDRHLAGPFAVGRTVASIVARWGFLDPARFSHAFKAAHGLSPSDYRAAHGVG